MSAAEVHATVPSVVASPQHTELQHSFRLFNLVHRSRVGRPIRSGVGGTEGRMDPVNRARRAFRAMLVTPDAARGGHVQ